MKAALSIHASAWPPNSVPRWLVWSGKTISSRRASVAGAVSPVSSGRMSGEACTDSLCDLRGRLEAGQPHRLAAVGEQRERRRLPQAEAAEEVLAHGFQLHLEQDEAGRGALGGELAQRHVEHATAGAVVLVVVHQQARVGGER